jgi:hypothetical protein
MVSKAAVAEYAAINFDSRPFDVRLAVSQSRDELAALIEDIDSELQHTVASQSYSYAEKIRTIASRKLSALEVS